MTSFNAFWVEKDEQGTRHQVITREIDDLPEGDVLIEVLYSSGLRVGEAVKLKIKDIDAERNLIRVNQGKGSKDRQTILSEKLKSDLLKYLCTKRDNEIYLF